MIISRLGNDSNQILPNLDQSPRMSSGQQPYLDKHSLMSGDAGVKVESFISSASNPSSPSAARLQRPTPLSCEKPDGAASIVSPSRCKMHLASRKRNSPTIHNFPWQKEFNRDTILVDAVKVSALSTCKQRDWQMYSVLFVPSPRFPETEIAPSPVKKTLRKEPKHG